MWGILVRVCEKMPLPPYFFYCFLSLIKRRWFDNGSIWFKIKRGNLSETPLILVEKSGLEPPTSWLPVKRSSQLSYIPLKLTAKLNILHVIPWKSAVFRIICYSNFIRNSVSHSSILLDAEKIVPLGNNLSKVYSWHFSQLPQ